jgi:hypothetical protein
VRGQRHAPAAPYPRERPGTHFTAAWVGLRAGLDRCGKSRPPPRFDPRTVQPVGSRYTDYATRPIFFTCALEFLASRTYKLCPLSIISGVDSCLLLNATKKLLNLGFGIDVTL